MQAKGRPVRAYFVLVFVGFCSWLLSAAEVAKGSPLAIEDALRTHSFADASSLVFSPDGMTVAYRVTDNQRHKCGPEMFAISGATSPTESDLFISNIVTGETRDLTAQLGDNWSPTWSPNGRYLGFLSDRAADRQANLWVWDSRKNSLRMITALPIRAARKNHLFWTTDSTAVFITGVPKNISIEEYSKRVARPELSSPPGRPALGPNVILYESGNGASDNTQEPGPPMFNLNEESLHDVVKINIETGEIQTIVAGQRIENYSISPDGRFLVYSTPKSFFKAGSFRRIYDLNAIDLSTGQTVLLGSNILLNDVFTWSASGSHLAYAAYGTDSNSYELYVACPRNRTTSKIATLTHQTNDGLWITPIWDRREEFLYFILDGALKRTPVAPGGIVESFPIANRTIEYVITQSDGVLWELPDGKELSTLVLTHDEEGKEDGFYQLDLDSGKSQKLREGDECYACNWPPTDRNSFLTVASPRGKHFVYVAQSATHSPELWTMNVASSSAVQLTHLNPQFDRHQVGTTKIIDWLSDDGIPLRGALLLPDNYQPSVRYPTILVAYPGVRMSNNADRFGLGMFPGPFNAQLFSTRGYAVFVPDTVEQVGNRMTAVVKSVLPAISKLVEAGIADPDRLGVIGHSQGGFAVLELLVQTNRFKAAVAADGWGDNTAYYGIMQKDGSAYEYGQAELQLGGMPWQYPLRYIQNSPIYYLDRVHTPLLLIHGGADESHPSFLADEIFLGLRRLGKTIEYAKYEGEPHSPDEWSYSDQLDVAARVITWFAHYLK